MINNKWAPETIELLWIYLWMTHKKQFDFYICTFSWIANLLKRIQMQYIFQNTSVLLKSNMCFLPMTFAQGAKCSAAVMPRHSTPLHRREISPTLWNTHQVKKKCMQFVYISETYAKSSNSFVLHSQKNASRVQTYTLPMHSSKLKHLRLSQWLQKLLILSTQPQHHIFPRPLLSPILKTDM